MRSLTLFCGGLALLVVAACTTGSAEQHTAVACEQAKPEIIHALHQSDSLLAVGDSVGAWWGKAYAMSSLPSEASQVIPFTWACQHFPVPRSELDRSLAFLARETHLYQKDTTSLFRRGGPANYFVDDRSLDAHFIWLYQQFHATWVTEADSHAVRWIQTLYPD